MGRKHEPVFRLVLTDSKNSTKSGRSLEILGNYDARHAEDSVFKADRITYWMSKGAQPSLTVHNLLLDKKIIEGKKINALPLKKPIVKEEPREKSEEKAEKKIGKKEEKSDEVREETATSEAEIGEEKVEKKTEEATEIV